MSEYEESDIARRLYSILRQPTPCSPHTYPETTTRYATSSTRDEPFSRDAPPSEAMSYRPGAAKSSAKYAIEVGREVTPGMLQDGTLTVNHPYVDRYVAHLAIAHHVATGQSVAGPSTPRRPRYMAGVPALGRVEDVSEVLQLGEQLNELQSACVLALAALRVYTDHHHPSHFALWGSAVQARTAAVVERIYYHSPRLIVSPVCWTGTRPQLWLLRIQQLLAFPPERKETAPARMVLRQRKTRGTTHPAQGGKGKAVDRGLNGAPEQSGTKRARFLGHEEGGLAIAEVAPGVLLATMGAEKAVTDVKGGGAMATVASPAPTRRSSRQAIRRGEELELPAGPSETATTSANATRSARPSPGDSFPSRDSSTAVSDASENTAVAEERVPVQSKKRKASELKLEMPTVETDQSAVLGGPEDTEPRRKTRRTVAQVPDAVAVPQTTNAARKRRSGARTRK